MSQQFKRKPILWIMTDLFGLIILQAGAFQFFELEIPYVSDFFAPVSTTLLLSLGGAIMVISVLLYLVPIIKANSGDVNEKSEAVERSKR